jgi:hypothetical protein
MVCTKLKEKRVAMESAGITLLKGDLTIISPGPPPVDRENACERIRPALD